MRGDYYRLCDLLGITSRHRSWNAPAIAHYWTLLDREYREGNIGSLTEESFDRFLQIRGWDDSWPALLLALVRTGSNTIVTDHSLLFRRGAGIKVGRYYYTITDWDRYGSPTLEKAYLGHRGWRTWLKAIPQNWHWKRWGFDFNEAGYYLTFGIDLAKRSAHFWIYLGGRCSFHFAINRNDLRGNGRSWGFGRAPEAKS